MKFQSLRREARESPQIDTMYCGTQLSKTKAEVRCGALSSSIHEHWQANETEKEGAETHLHEHAKKVSDEQ